MSKDEMSKDEMSEARNKMARKDGVDSPPGSADRSPPAYPQEGVANTCRSFDEYVRMFDLKAEDWGDGPVLDAAGGASSFTAHFTSMGIPSVAADPFYARSPATAIEGARREIAASSAKLEAAAAHYDWRYYGNPQRHRQLREASLERFAADFSRTDAASRYVPAALPRLPFADNTFQLALCSHFLFLYADQFDDAFHREALVELLRVVRPGGTVCVYPMVTLSWEPYPHFSALESFLQEMAAVRTTSTRLPFMPKQSSVLRLTKYG